MKVYLYMLLGIMSQFHLKAQTVTDTDGNIYNSVTIGTQVWMKENLKTTKYNDGTPIPNITNDSAWNTLKTPAYCWYTNNAVLYKVTYGGLYNWYAMNTNKLCPVNWHIPTSAEWDTLAAYLGGSSIAAGKMKEAGTNHWLSPNTGATNSSGFTALPAGWRWAKGSYFDLMRTATAWWVYDSIGNARYCQSDATYLGYTSADKINGHSVRCLKDPQTSVNTLQACNNVTVYPNPAKDKLYLKTNKFSKVHITIFDLRGKKVLEKQWDSSPIDISKLPKGIYLVRIADNENMITNKLLKNK